MPKAGSNVNTPWSRLMVAMSSTSGPSVPLRTGSAVVVPAGFFSSKFLLLIRRGPSKCRATMLRDGQSRRFAWTTVGIKAPEKTARHRSGRLARSADACVLLAELIHPARGVHDLLLAGIERMAVRADFNVEVVAHGRAGLEGVAAAAGHRDLFVVRMNGFFHGSISAQRMGCVQTARFRRAKK